MSKREHHLEVKQAAELLHLPIRTLRYRIQTGKLPAKNVPSRGGRNGLKYLVPLSALPPSTQAEYLEMQGVTIKKWKHKDNSKRCQHSNILGQQCDFLSSWAKDVTLARADLVHAWLKVKSPARKMQKTTAALNQFLTAYNSGQLYPQIYKTLGSISRGTLYRWVKQYIDSGNELAALVPDWGNKRGAIKVTNDESNYLLSQLLHQNRIKVETAIRLTKYILERRHLPSPSSSITLRRFVENFKKNHYDLWTLMREGEKALNDKVLPNSL